MPLTWSQRTTGLATTRTDQAHSVAPCDHGSARMLRDAFSTVWLSTAFDGFAVRKGTER